MPQQKSPGARPGLSIRCSRRSERPRDFQAAKPSGIAAGKERISAIRIEVAMRVVVRHVDDLDADIEILDRRPSDVRADLPLRTVRVEGREWVEVRATRGGHR